MGEVQWIKLYVNTFNVSRKLKQIEQMKGGDTIIVVWIKLLCLAGSVNDGGMVYVTPDIPFTVEGLAEELRKPVKAVRQALDTLARYDQIIMDDAGFIRVSSWDKYQDLDRLEEIRAKDRERKRVKREQEKQNSKRDNSTDSPRNIRGQSTESPVIEEEGETESAIHSFILSRASGEKNDVTDEGADKERVKRELMGGELGGGVVFISSQEFDKLLDELSLDELNHYIGIVRDCELRGQKFKRKTHFQAIMEMAMADRMKDINYKRRAKKPKGVQPPENSSFDTDEAFTANVKQTFGEDFNLDEFNKN